MYLSPIALDKDKHAGLTFTPGSSYAYAANLSVAPLSGLEVPEAARYYPIVFLPADQGAALPHALLGLSGKNTYVNADGQWTVGYIPAMIRKYPFGLADVTGGDAYTPKAVLVIDEAAEHFQNPTGQPLLEADGNLGEVAKTAAEFVSAHQRQLLATIEAFKEVEAAGILIDKTLTIQAKDANGENVTRMIGGFRLINREKFSSISDETLLKWAKNGVLEIIHAHWFSLGNLQAVAAASSLHKPTKEVLQ